MLFYFLFYTDDDLRTFTLLFYVVLFLCLFNIGKNEPCIFLTQNLVPGRFSLGRFHCYSQITLRHPLSIPNSIGFTVFRVIDIHDIHCNIIFSHQLHKIMEVHLKKKKFNANFCMKLASFFLA
jgi:hypothetical protein